MALTLSVLLRLVVIGAILAGGLIAGLLGLGIGAQYGGSFCEPCRFNDVTGYEATGQVGFLIGAPLGLLIGAVITWVLLTRRAARVKESYDES